MTKFRRTSKNKQNKNKQSKNKNQTRKYYSGGSFVSQAASRARAGVGQAATAAASVIEKGQNAIYDYRTRNFFKRLPPLNIPDELMHNEDSYIKQTNEHLEKIYGLLSRSNCFLNSVLK